MKIATVEVFTDRYGFDKDQFTIVGISGGMKIGEEDWFLIWDELSKMDMEGIDANKCFSFKLKRKMYDDGSGNKVEGFELVEGR